MAQDYHNLIVWQKAVELTICGYKVTQAFPKSETYGQTSQMRRASISVASNIAEGRGRLNAAESRQFPGLAQGLVFELKTQLLIANKPGFISEHSSHEVDFLRDEVSKILRTFIQRLGLPSKAHAPSAEVLRALN